MSFRELNSPQITPQINLSRKPDELVFEVGMEAFFEFSFWMAEELLELVAEHEFREESRQETQQREKVKRLLADRASAANPDSVV